MARKKLVPAVPVSGWLPEGWSVEYRKRRFSEKVDKYYIHPSSAKKLRSKPEVMRFLRKEPNDINHIAFQKATSDQKSHKQLHKQLVQIDHCPSDLSEGWVVEKRLRRSGRHKGNVDLYYIHPSSAKKLRSKPEVMRFPSKEPNDMNHIAFQKAASDQKSHKQLHKQLVQIDHCPSDLSEGRMVEKRLRRSSRYKGQEDSYYIHPSSAKKLRSKPEVMRFLNKEPKDINHIAIQKAASYQKSQGQHHKQLVQIDHCPSDLSEGWMVEKRLGRSDHHKGQVDSQLVKIEKSEKEQTSTSKHLILTKEQTLIEYIRSKVKRTVTRKCLVLTKEPISSPTVDSLKGPVPSLLVETSTQCTESNCADPPLKLAPQILLDAPTKLEVNSAESHTTPVTIKDIEKLEQRLGNFRIECNENCGESGKGPLPIEGQGLDLRQKQRQKRKTEAEFDLPSKYLKQLNGSREECGDMLDQDYQKEMSVPRELEEKLEKLQLVVEQASNVKCEGTTDELLEKLGKLNLSRACVGDLWLDPCIEFAYKTLTGDSLVLEDVANIPHPND